MVGIEEDWGGGLEESCSSRFEETPLVITSTLNVLSSNHLFSRSWGASSGADPRLSEAASQRVPEHADNKAIFERGGGELN